MLKDRPVVRHSDRYELWQGWGGGKMIDMDKNGEKDELVGLVGLKTDEAE